MNNNEKLNASKLSQILCFSATDMKTNIENNIKLHFIAYVNRFVNKLFEKEHNEIIEATIHGNKNKISKELAKIRYDIKQDLINNTLLSNEKYHNFITIHKTKIFPYNCKNTYQHDIDNNPQKYIKSMIYMCLQIEAIGGKSFQFFPLRNNTIPKYIQIDTTVLIRLFEEEIDYNQAQEYRNNIFEHKNYIWEKYFKTNKKIFKQKKYSFDYVLYTDGFGVSIKLLHDNFVLKNQIIKDKKKNKKDSIFEICNTMKTNEEKVEYRNKLFLEQKQKEDAYKLSVKEERDKYKEIFKKLPKEEQQRLLAEKKVFNEFPYIEDLDETQFEHLKKSNWVVVDPGKRCLLYIKNNNPDIKPKNKLRRYISRIKNKTRRKHNKKIYIKQINDKTENIDKIKNIIKITNTINYKSKLIEKNKIKSNYEKYLKYKTRRNKQNNYKNKKEIKQNIKHNQEKIQNKNNTDGSIKHIGNITKKTVTIQKRNKKSLRTRKTNCLRYTNKRYIKETKRLKYQKLLHNYKNKNKINKIENELSSYNSKTCNYDEFKKYIKKKNEINKILIDKYKEKIFRRYKWYGFINRKKVDNKIVNEIKKKFGKDVILCYGDWSIGKQMRNFISTPNIRLKRKLNEHFIIYNVDEYRTSCLNYKTETENDNFHYLDKDQKSRKIHSILTYQMENNCLGCINRDENAVRNMLKIVNRYLLDKTRPKNFKRSTIKPKRTVNSKQIKKPKNDTNSSKKAKLSKKSQLIVSSSSIVL